MTDTKFVENTTEQPKKTHGFRNFMIKFILVFLLLAAGYVYWFYFNQYSDGEQSGIVNKISRKGDIFKTYEGYITSSSPNTIIQQGAVNRNILYFSINNKAIADSLNGIENKVIKLHYTQYRKSLPWRGENYDGKNAETGQYIVDKIVSIQDNPQSNNLPSTGY